MHLDRAVDDVVQHFGAEELDDRDLRARFVAGVDLVRRMHRQQARRLDLRRGVGDPVLHRLLFGERAAEGLAAERIAAHDLECALHLAEPAHAVVDAPRPEALLRDAESVADAAEHVGHWHADILVLDLAMRAVGLAHHRHRTDDVEAGGVRRNDDLTHPRVRLRFGIGDAHHDGERRTDGAAREPLVAVDHPLVAVPHGTRAKPRRVGARDLGFRHREA